MRNWIDHKREDIHGIPFMRFHGYYAKFSSTDVNNRRTIPTRPPQEYVSFVKKVSETVSIVIWRLYKWEGEMYSDKPRDLVLYWRSAKITNGIFHGHQNHKTLDEVVEFYL